MPKKCYYKYVNQNGKEGKSMNVPERIQELRKQKGISQEELANELGVSRQAVSKWESGQSFPELDNIVALSDYFGVSADYVLKGTETVQAPKSQVPIPTEPKMSLSDRLRRFAERRIRTEENEEKEVIFQLAMTQRQKSALAMTILVCSAAISVIGAYALGAFFDSNRTYQWIAALGIMLIGFGMYHVGKRLLAKEPPFIIKYINRATFIFAVVFLTAVHSVLSYMDYFPSERSGFAFIYVFAAATLYAGIMLYRKIKRMRAEMEIDGELTEQSTK